MKRYCFRIAVTLATGLLLASGACAVSFWLTDQADGTPVNWVEVLPGSTFTLYAYMNAPEVGDTFDFMVGYDVSSANSWGAVGWPTLNRLTMVSTADEIAASINPMFTAGSSVTFGSAREVSNPDLGGRPWGIDVVGRLAEGSAIGTQRLFSFTLRNNSDFAHSHWVIISDAGGSSSYTSAWKSGTTSYRDSDALRIYPSVPEPSGLLALVCGVGGLIAIRRRRR